MGRKPISPKQRAQPISFSLKPHLIEKIDDYASDLRFNRSKFLQQAVTEYMTRHIVNANNLDLSSNVHDMSLGRRVAVGLAALQEANREGETIPKAIMDALRRELNLLDVQEDTNFHDQFLPETGNLVSGNREDEFDTDREVNGIVYKLFKVYDTKEEAAREASFHRRGKLARWARAMKVKGGQFEGKWGAYISRAVKGE